MGNAALEFGKDIRAWLEQGHVGNARFNLERNTVATIQNANAYVETSPELIAASQDLQREVAIWLDQAKNYGGEDRGPGAEAQRARAIQAAERYMALLSAAPQSRKADILRL